MSKIPYENFSLFKPTREPNVFEVDLGKIILVEDLKVGGYTSFFKPDIAVVSEGETKEEAVNNLLSTYIDVLNAGNCFLKLKIKKILPK